MALARVVTFENVNKDRIEELKREIASSEGPPEGIPSTEILVLHDADAEKSLVVVFFDSEDDYAKATRRSARCRPATPRAGAPPWANTRSRSE